MPVRSKDRLIEGTAKEYVGEHQRGRVAFGEPMMEDHAGSEVYQGVSVEPSEDVAANNCAPGIPQS